MAWKRSAWSILQEEVDLRLKLCVANINLEFDLLTISDLLGVNGFNRDTQTMILIITEIIIHSKYFPNSDWLKAHA